MALVKYRSTSPYALTKQSTWYLDLYEPRDIPPAEDDEEIVVESRFHQRPDLLSEARYHTPNFFWVFAVRNMDKIKDVIFDLKAGMTIIVPSKDHLDRLR